MKSWEAGLAEAAAAVTVGGASPAIIDRIQAILLHDLALGRLAVGYPVVKAGARVAAAWGDGGHRVWATGGTAGLAGSVFANSAFLAASRQEDFWGVLHCGPVVIPPALAVAEAKGRTVAELIAALVAGFGVALVTARRFGAGAGARGFRATPLFGQLGAAVTAGRLLGLDSPGLLRALAFAAVTPSGTVGSLLAGTAEWQVEAPLAAVQGTVAALMACDASLTTSPRPLTGQGSFAAAFAGEDVLPETGPEPPSPDELTRAVLEVGLKRYPVHIACMSAVEAALAARGDACIHLDAAARVEVSVPVADVPLVSGRGLFDQPWQAGLSVPTLVAAALLQGGFADPDFARVNDPDVQDLAGRVQVSGDPTLAPQMARVVVHSQRGIWRGSVDAPARLYRPSFVEVERRLTTGGGAGAPSAAGALASLITAIRALPSEVDVVPSLSLVLTQVMSL